MNSSLWVLWEQTSQVLENRTLILKINRAENQRRCGGKRHRDSEKSRWWRGSMKCHIVLPKQQYTHSQGGKRRLSHYSGLLSPTALYLFWPHCSSPVLLISEIEELLSANSSYGSLWQGSWVKMFCPFVPVSTTVLDSTVTPKETNQQVRHLKCFYTSKHMFKPHVSPK